MLLVKAWVGKSEIHGFGLIAHEFIPKGTVVWKLVPGFDVILSEEEVLKLSPPAQNQIYHYAFFHLGLCKHVLSADDDRFTNHSDDANVEVYSEHAVATRDIHVGEEITNNYSDFGESINQTRPRLIAT